MERKLRQIERKLRETDEKLDHIIFRLMEEDPRVYYQKGIFENGDGNGHNSRKENGNAGYCNFKDI